MPEGGLGMQFHRDPGPGQSPLADEPPYNPPQVEVVVTAAQLEREQLYGGPAAPYGGPI